MDDLTFAKYDGIDFLFESLDKPWAIEADDNDPLRFEAHLYLANKGIISKSEWGEKIKKRWDTWVEQSTYTFLPKVWPKGVNMHPKGRCFWPSVDNYLIDVGDPDNADWEPGFGIENHLAMFRTKEVFRIPGYTDCFTRAKRELGARLRSRRPLPLNEEERLLWQIVRSPFLRTTLNDSLRGVAQGIIENKLVVFKDNPEGIDDSLSQLTPAEIFFLLTTNLEDPHFNLAKHFLNREIHGQRKDGSFSKNVIETCLFICSIYLSGIDPNGIVTNPAIAWLLNAQKKGGSWQYHGTDDIINVDKINGEDIFLTVFVLETLDLITNDKALPIWATTGAPKQPPLKVVPSIGHPLTIPQGMKWGDVSITFISDEAVEIRVKDPLGVKNFIELGFKDRRSNKPDRKWEILKLLAQNQGSISWKEKSASSKLKPHIKVLRRRLRDLFKMSDDPFFPYRQTNSYKAKFTISVREEN